MNSDIYQREIIENINRLKGKVKEAGLSLPVSWGSF
jgi:hypothetical protein